MFYFINHLRTWALLLFVTAFLGALFWARDQDPYQRIPFSLESASGKKVAGIAVLPKFRVKYPVALYVYNTGGNLLSCGTQLRQIAGLGFAAIAIEYDQESQEEFSDQFFALHQFVQKQSWALTNMVWISSGAGAQRTLGYAISGRGPRPDLLVAIGGGSVSTLHKSGAPVAAHSLLCPILLVNSGEDTLFPPTSCAQLASQLRSAGGSVQVCTLKGASHSPDSEHPSFLRALSEYCAKRVAPSDHVGVLIAKSADEAMASVTSNELNQLSGSRQFWLRKYWMAEILVVVSLLVLWRCRDTMHKLVSRFKAHARSPVLRLAAFALGILAVVVIAINLILPRLEFSESRLTMAKRFLPPIRLEDSLYLANQAGAQHVTLGTILENVQLATLQRNQFYKELDDQMFEQFILSPRIDSQPSEWNWRREFYINFQPRIRKERDSIAAAKIVVEYLREKVGIDPSLKAGTKIETAWIQQTTDEAGFQSMYVAVLRSVGIAARLNNLKQAELWTGDKWQTAPVPQLFYITSAGD